MALEHDLTRVYAASCTDMAGQIERYRRCLARYADLYGPGDVAVFRSPGRVNLIGEHTDYNHGFVLPVALDKDVLLLARKRDDNRVRLANTEQQFAAHEFALSTNIPLCPDVPWANYCQGPAQWLVRHTGPGLQGMDVLVDGQAPWGVPRGSGLSSSSALVVVSAVALVWLNGLDLSGPSLADACGEAEWYVGTRGGVMDQFIALMGKAGQALFLDCRPVGQPPSYHWEHVCLPEHYSLVIMDSQVEHRNTTNAFNQRVAETRIGAEILGRHIEGLTHLRDAEDLGWEGVEQFLPETLSREGLGQYGINLDEIMAGGNVPRVDVLQIRKRCRHVVTENARVRRAVQALSENDMAALVSLMAQAHASARDDYEISVPEVEALVDLATDTDDRIGARLTGAGWGGSVVAICPDELLPKLDERLGKHLSAASGRGSSHFICQAANGAGLVHCTTL